MPGSSCQEESWGADAKVLRQRVWGASAESGLRVRKVVEASGAAGVHGVLRLVRLTPQVTQDDIVKNTKKVIAAIRR